MANLRADAMPTASMEAGLNVCDADGGGDLGYTCRKDLPASRRELL
jgi:hypothetical protein